MRYLIVLAALLGLTTGCITLAAYSAYKYFTAERQSTVQAREVQNQNAPGPAQDNQAPANTPSK